MKKKLLFFFKRRSGGVPPVNDSDWITGDGNSMVTGSGDNLVFGLTVFKRKDDGRPGNK